MKDYYAILGLPETAGPDAVNDAKRRLSFLYHPDSRAKDMDAGFADERIREVNEAWEVLIDPVTRAEYDRARRLDAANSGGATGGTNQRAGQAPGTSGHARQSSEQGPRASTRQEPPASGGTGTRRGPGTDSPSETPRDTAAPSRHDSNPGAKHVLLWVALVGIILVAVLLGVNQLGGGGSDGYGGDVQAGDVTTASAGGAAAESQPTIRPTAAQKTIHYGETVSGSVTSGDKPEAWFFNAVKGDVVTIQTFQVTGAAYRPAFTLYDPSGAQLYFVSDVGGGDYFNVLAGKPLKFDGTYKISVGSYGGQRDDGQYQLSIKKKDVPTVQLGQDVTGTLDSSSDYMDYKINLQVGQHISAEVRPSGPGAKLPSVDLLDPTGAEEKIGFGCVQGQKTNDVETNAKFSGVYTLHVYGGCDGVGQFQLTIR